jgi:hypothetical protein
MQEWHMKTVVLGFLLTMLAAGFSGGLLRGQGSVATTRAATTQFAAETIPGRTDGLRVRLYAPKFEMTEGEKFAIIVEVENLNLPGAEPLKLTNNVIQDVRVPNDSAAPRMIGAFPQAIPVVHLLRPVTTKGVFSSTPPVQFTHERVPFVTVPLRECALAKYFIGSLLTPGDNVVNAELEMNGKVVARSEEIHIRCIAEKPANGKREP